MVKSEITSSVILLLFLKSYKNYFFHHFLKNNYVKFGLIKKKCCEEFCQNCPENFEKTCFFLFSLKFLVVLFFLMENLDLCEEKQIFFALLIFFFNWKTFTRKIENRGKKSTKLFRYLSNYHYYSINILGKSQ